MLSPHAYLLVLAIALDAAPAFARHEPAIEQVMVYHEPGRFGGWPANHGIWSWRSPPQETPRDEILVGFSAGHHKDLGPTRHNIDHDKPEEHLLARSLDGGRTWAIENPARQGVLIGTAGMRHGTVPTEYTEAEPVDCPGGIDFTHAGFAMTCRMAGTDFGVSRFYYSYDRGHNWKGPFQLPLFGQPGIAARTDYVVNGPHECMLFLTASKSNRREGRPICVRTTDGGKTWDFVSYIGPEPAGYAIMPSTVRLSPGRLLTTVRRAEDQPKRSWIDAWTSADEGRSWSSLKEPVPDTGEGNPPHLIRLGDGRLCLTYGVRAKPFGIFARLSGDAGQTWSEPITLRGDGGGRDIGYPRSVQRSDGKVVTVYYFWDEATGPERYIAASIWDPDAF
ncbi:MAG TPA: sialidase family protein [Pirellulales bacterium]|nr:sialidase family protein [Pirellulales bacterium]